MSSLIKCNLFNLESLFLIPRPAVSEAHCLIPRRRCCCCCCCWFQDKAFERFARKKKSANRTAHTVLWSRLDNTHLAPLSLSFQMKCNRFSFKSPLMGVLMTPLFWKAGLNRVPFYCFINFLLQIALEDMHPSTKPGAAINQALANLTLDDKLRSPFRVQPFRLTSLWAACGQ